MDKTLERILEQMKKQGVTAVEMEDLLNVPRGSFSNWKRGMGKSYYAYIDKIADRLGVSIDYLVRGYEVGSLSSRESKLITEFRKLSDRAQRVVLENVTARQNRQNGAPSEQKLYT